MGLGYEGGVLLPPGCTPTGEMITPRLGLRRAIQSRHTSSVLRVEKGEG